MGSSGTVTARFWSDKVTCLTDCAVDEYEADFSVQKDIPARWRRPVVRMVALWNLDGLALFDTDAWGHPEVHPSAAPEVMEGKPALLHQNSTLHVLNNCCASGVPFSALALAIYHLGGNT